LLRCKRLTWQQLRNGVAAIREEEALVAVEPSLAEVDKWEQGHFREEEIRNKAIAVNKDYEAAVRAKYFKF
jgi:hypothetical protein